LKKKSGLPLGHIENANSSSMELNKEKVYMIPSGQQPFIINLGWQHRRDEKAMK
jgi:hypothetical protein